VIAGPPTPVRKGNEVIGTSRRIEVWTQDGLTEISLYAEEAAALAWPDDPTLRQQMLFARHDCDVYKRALEAITKTTRDPITIALEVLGED
jgi:hypothetical protein